MRRTILVAALAVTALFSGAGTHLLQNHQAVETAATTPAYHWFGNNVETCGSTPIYRSCAGFQWWIVTAHVAGWYNGYNVVLATRSGYPYCTASGYYVSVTGCTWHGGGSEVHVVISWQNCVGPLGLGCVSDWADMGFNAWGRMNYYKEGWADDVP